MKKFLLVVVLVLCMALPAAAGTTETVTTSDGLLKAVADSSVERIVIAGNISLSADTPVTGGEEYYCGLLISRNLTLQINKDCTLSIVGNSNRPIVGIFNQDKALTITGQGTINVTDSCSGYLAGVAVVGDGAADTAIVNIADGVKITASGGIYNYAVGASNAKVNILNAVLSGDFLDDDGIINVYGGKFTADPSNYLGADCASSDITETPYLYKVTSNAQLSFGVNLLELDVTGGALSEDITVALSADAVSCTSFDAIVVTPEKEVDGLSYEVSEKDGTIRFTATQDCAAGEYNFKVAACGNDGTNYLGQETKEGEEITIKVTNTQKSGGSSGGCNAGFAGLALAAFALLAAKRKK